MKDEGQIRYRLRGAQDRLLALEYYRDKVCIPIADHHGVQDASSDLRECEAEIRVLEWVLG